MNIIEFTDDSEFSEIPNNLLSDTSLSWKARGVMCYLLAFSCDDKTSVDEMTFYSSDTSGVISSALVELQSAGYNVRGMVDSFDSSNRIVANSYIQRKGIREKVFKLHGDVCLRCGSDEHITLDHVVPVSRGGKNTISNLQPLCRSCNSTKGTKTIDYRK